MSKQTTISIDVQSKETQDRLRLEAAKRGLTRSNYCRLLLEMATKNYTDFEIPDHPIIIKDPNQKE